VSLDRRWIKVISSERSFIFCGVDPTLLRDGIDLMTPGVVIGTLHHYLDNISLTRQTALVQLGHLVIVRGSNGVQQSQRGVGTINSE
jgi:hypothetical protein